ncbi:MAG: hypothetical protein P8J79_14185 [Halioglobus sp.]|nr:hypothetical protein [Halioglobus sp.]
MKGRTRRQKTARQVGIFSIPATVASVMILTYAFLEQSVSAWRYVVVLLRTRSKALVHKFLGTRSLARHLLDISYTLRLLRTPNNSIDTN